MIAFAFLGPDGIPTGGGIGPALPDGAVALPAPFTTAELPRLRCRAGQWEARPAPPPPSAEDVAAWQAAMLVQARAEAVGRINALTDRFRQTEMTVIAGQDELYRLKRAEAVAYLAEAALRGEPAALADYPLLAAELGVTAETPWQLAQIWLHRAAATTAALAASEAARHAALAAIAAAPDAAAMERIISLFPPAPDAPFSTGP